MKVTAIPGARCPKESNPRDYITDNQPEDVPDSIYYRRLVADGSLVEEKVQGTRIKDQGKKANP